MMTHSACLSSSCGREVPPNSLLGNPGETSNEAYSTHVMATRSKSVRILAKSLYKELATQGYDQQEVVSFATALLSEVTDNLKKRPDAHQ